MKLSSVIAAVSTPPGKGGVAVIRVSGDDALGVAERVFAPKSGKALAEIKPRTQVFGTISYAGAPVDDGLLCYFKAPASYTGEDVVEISCHGGALVTRTVLEAVFAAGARPAEAGEFTRRAFLNGKLTLTEAEAVGTLLDAKSRAQLSLCTEGARGLLARRLEELRRLLTDALSSMYARIDYPDEDLGEFDTDMLIERLSLAEDGMRKLLDSYATGRAVCEGIDTVIAGKPNVGKSSLYNLLLGEDAAIVTDVAGTTRDVLSAELSLGRVLLRLSDTAGVRTAASDEVERIGIERTKRRIAEAELVLAVFDASRPLSDEDRELIAALDGVRATRVAIVNKCDRERALDVAPIAEGFECVVEISVTEAPEEARLRLAKLMDALFTDEKIRIGYDAVIANARQNARLERAHEHLTTAISALRAGLWQDAAASDVERALGELAELDGRAVSEEVVADIFSKFCVGK